MEVRLFSNPSEFYEAAAGWLETEPFSGNVIAWWTSGAIGGTRPHHHDDLWMTIVEDETIVGAAMHTPPFNLALPKVPAEAAVALAHTLAEHGRSLPGVNGVVESVTAFAQTWSALTGQPSERTTAMRLYYLGTLAPPSGVTGMSRLAVDGDTELVTQWAEAFHWESTHSQPPRDWAADADRLISGRGLHLWLDEGGEVVSMANRSGPAHGVARIGPVYTPPGKRRNGYGAAVTAAASQAALDGGARDVILYTDLANETSNAIYQSIGYLPDHDAEERAFLEPSG